MTTDLGQIKKVSIRDVWKHEEKEFTPWLALEANISKLAEELDLGELQVEGDPVGSLLPERKRQFAEPPLHAIRLNVRKVLAIRPRCALVGAALSKRMSQNIVTADLVVQRVEAIAGFCHRFRL